MLDVFGFVHKFGPYQYVKLQRANERPQTDHVIRGPMRGLKKNCMGRGLTKKQRQHMDIATTRPTRPRGPSW